ncbi:hypothetical protein ACLOJK_003371 [Asimina triloba]
MGEGRRGEFGLEQRNQDCQSYGISQPFERVAEATMNSESLFVGGWDPVVSMVEDVGSKGPMASHHQMDLSSYGVGVLGSSSQLGQFSPGGGLGKLNQRWKGADHGMTSIDEDSISDDRNPGGSSPQGNKRKRTSDGHTVESPPQFDSMQNEAPATTAESLKERDEKKQKSVENPSLNVRKANAKQPKDQSKTKDSPKEDYIHVRARRGQATNSHSLAERIRREKISERMKFLQDLVPGCNKVTGKAVMLDEIINYVQSLQRQVEFLSMKLAAVNPELNFDIEHIFPKEMLHSQDSGPPVLGFCSAVSTSQARLSGQGVVQPEIGIFNFENSRNMLKANNTQFSSMAQIPSVWDDELQGVVQMGFVSGIPPDGLEPHGKVEADLDTAK